MYYTKWDIWTEFANREGKGIVVNFLVKHPPEADISLNNQNQIHTQIHTGCEDGQSFTTQNELDVNFVTILLLNVVGKKCEGPQQRNQILTQHKHELSSGLDVGSGVWRQC